MTSLVLVDANGTLKTLKAKDVTLDSLYKKCGFRVSDDFERRHTWHTSLRDKTDNNKKTEYTVSLWAKKTGKANYENKYDLPPPIDKDLYYGTCAIISTNADGEILDLTKEIWERIYTKLFGGFEDIGVEDEFSEDELEGVDPALLTSHGYLKDDFVVSDKESETTSSPPSPKMKGKTTNSKMLKTKREPKAKSGEVTTKAKSGEVTTKAKSGEVAAKKPRSKPKPKQSKAASTKTSIETNEAAENEPDSVSELEEEVYNFTDEE